MRKYLATLHQRSDQHKRNFALLTSAGVTLVIFAIWSTVTFGNHAVVAEKVVRPTESSPLSTLLGEVGASLGVIKSNLNELKQGLEVVHYTNPNARE